MLKQIFEDLQLLNTQDPDDIFEMAQEIVYGCETTEKALSEPMGIEFQMLAATVKSIENSMKLSMNDKFGKAEKYGKYKDTVQKAMYRIHDCPTQLSESQYRSLKTSLMRLAIAKLELI